MATINSIRPTENRHRARHVPSERSDRDRSVLAEMLSRRGILTISTRFVAIAFAAWGLAQGVKGICDFLHITADIPSKWPLSMFRAEIPGIDRPFWDLLIGLGIMLAFYWLVRRATGRITESLLGLIAVAFLLVLGTNVIHGIDYGLVNPHQAPLQYYHDSVDVTSAGEFMRGFEASQAELGCHSQTHPPGAVLFFYGLINVVGHSAGVSIAIAAMAVGLSGIFFYRLLLYDFDHKTSAYVTLLFLLIPSVAVYYCATLDAIIAACFLGTLVALRHPHPLPGIIGMTVGLCCASFLTFGACFLIPVIVGFELLTRRTAYRAALVLLGTGMFYAMIYGLFGLNYLTSFQTASALENPAGFLLFAEPASYFITRLENVCDIAIFFGPFLLLLCAFGLRMLWQRREHDELFVLSGLGILTLAAMFLTGAFRTGETARACLFIYPLLMLPVAAYLVQQRFLAWQKRRLLLVVFGQTLAMQTLGGFFW